MEQLRLDAAVKISKMSLEELGNYLRGLEEIDPALLERLKRDPRKGTTRLAERCARRREAEREERERLLRLKKREGELYRAGCDLIAGVDEVGRGPLAGPVMAAAVIMPQGSMIAGVDDSKRLSAPRREELYDKIREEAVACGIGAVSATGIDRIGIAAATGLAMRRALDELEVTPGHVLIDGGIRIPGLELPHDNIQGGDARCYVVASASIAAKVERDRIMVELGREYPEYGFAENKGYGTDGHLAAVERCGYSEVHRASFRFHDKDQLTFRRV